MSHHLDSPLARQDARLNITDQYVFDVPGATVFVMDVRTSLAGEDKPLGFHPEGRYEFKIHLDGAAVEDLTYRFVFEDGPDYRVYRLTGAEAADDTAVGVQIAHGHLGKEITGDGDETIWAGRAAEPFYLDLRQLGAVDELVQHGRDADLRPPADVASTFAGSTVSTIVLRVPLTDPRLRTGRPIRVWSVTKLATDAGGWGQINRAGLPMIWPIFRDHDSQAASHANETVPADDIANYGAATGELIAEAVRRLETSGRPEAYAAEVVQRIFPDTLPYVVGTPAAFSFAAFNGRHLGDNAPEVMFSLVTNSAVSTGLAPTTTSDEFPYVIPAN
ncbi:DUF4331 domain-containing protein [Actinoplanes sp. TRM 88003]|uniref:DUF4331 domain-containing protein n=1 Tax=Paractinoplanes aksuensis TaxID=2939490 RepID=A0ABT1DWH5_9ACTN|nr:DUF4331 family protein [Actinoplanes aksuensis]MCO8275204.1 DUF4331 domain-containing protein [Actinoplanes aksuensis]